VTATCIGSVMLHVEDQKASLVVSINQGGRVALVVAVNHGWRAGLRRRIRGMYTQYRDGTCIRVGTRMLFSSRHVVFVNMGRCRPAEALELNLLLRENC
jgi:hypothetical protein